MRRLKTQYTLLASSIVRTMFTQSIASSAVAAWALISILPSVSCGPTSPHDVFSRTSAAGIDLKPLVSQLSKTAQIYYEGSELFTNYTVRWSNLSPPTPNVVIAPGTEKDVSKIVRSRSRYRKRTLTT